MRQRSAVTLCFHARREQRWGIRAQTAGDATPTLREAERQQSFAENKQQPGRDKRDSPADAVSLRLHTLSTPQKQIPAEAFHVQAVADVRAATLQPGGVGRTRFVPGFRRHCLETSTAHARTHRCETIPTQDAYAISSQPSYARKNMKNTYTHKPTPAWMT